MDLGVEGLVENLTTNGQEDLDQDKLTLFKTKLKPRINNDETIKYVYRLIYHRLKEKHAQIRYSAFLLLDFLFHQSDLFRCLVLKNIDHIFELCLGINHISKRISTKKSIRLEDITKCDLFLQPKTWAKKLQTKTLIQFRKWKNTFTLEQPMLKDIYKYLVNKGMFQSLPSTSKNDNIQRSKSVDKNILDKFDQKIEQLEKFANFLIAKIDSCFESLIPKINLIEEKNSDQCEHLNMRPMQGLSFNIILSSKIEIIRDSTNENIIKKLKKLCNNLAFFNKKLIIFEKRLIKAVGRNTELNNRIGFLKMKINSILTKENDMKIIENIPETTASKSIINNEVNDSDSDSNFEEVEETEEQFLLARIEGQKRQLKEQQEKRSIEIENQCRAPLPSGRLCPRRDTVNCPFHGKIIPRDNNGLPLDLELKRKEEEEKFQRESNQWKDPKYLRVLEEKIGIRLREKGAGDKKRKKYPNLIDLKRINSTPKNRLKSKLKIQ